VQQRHLVLDACLFACLAYSSALKMKVARSFETLINFCQIAWKIDALFIVTIVRNSYFLVFLVGLDIEEGKLGVSRRVVNVLRHVIHAVLFRMVLCIAQSV
jgi:hypothetical protein